jgi:hypothetical protein
MEVSYRPRVLYTGTLEYSTFPAFQIVHRRRQVEGDSESCGLLAHVLAEGI